MKKTKTETETTRIEWVTKPEDAVTYDDAFWVKRQRWGTYVSVGPDDLHIITSPSEELCISSTRWYLKAKQDGFSDGASVYSGKVEGKL
jgi:hypothetical protein